MEKITSLYPQYQRSQDRRQHNIPVAVDRRSGMDRRSQDRVVMDTQLTRDIFEVKSKVAKLETFAPALFANQVTTQSPTFASMNNFMQDQFVKTTKPDNAELAKKEAQLENQGSFPFAIGVGALTCIGLAAAALGGPVGVVILVGTSLYVGAKALKITMEKEIKEEQENAKKIR